LIEKTGLLAEDLMDPRFKSLNTPKGVGIHKKSNVDRWMKEEEVLALLSAARNDRESFSETAYCALALTANLALRVSECVDMRFSDFDSLASHNAVEVRVRKKGKRLHIGQKQLMEMSDAELIRRRREIVSATVQKQPPKVMTVYVGDLERNFIATIVGRRRVVERDRLFPFTKRYLQYLFNYYRARAGLRLKLSPHALRRFCSTRIKRLTGDERMATMRLRHAENVTRGSYLEFSPEHQIELLSKVQPVM
jgi:integrase